MACYKPISAYRREDGEIVFAERGKIQQYLQIACGQCIGCRLERSRQWAMRCMHEAKMHRYNSFLTLTYNDNNIPAGGTLHYYDFQRFMRRLRKALGRKGGKLRNGLAFTAAPGSSYGAPPHTPRFYMCGEYGEQFHRPHFHVCLFGTDFNDKKYLAKTKTGSKLYRSETLERLWPLGFSSIGEITFESAAYVARYVMKKITGTRAKKHYEKIETETGEIIQLKPEFNNMSRRPGIGKNWLERFEADVYPHAKVIVRGIKTNPPRYYDKIYKASHPTEWEAIEYDRYLLGKQQHENQLEHRLRAREQVAAAKIAMLKRKI